MDNRSFRLINIKAPGSFTIEAAVIVPITMVVMVSIIFLTFFAYDKVTMTAVCDYALMETAGNIGRDQNTVQTGITQLLNERLLAVSGAGTNVSGGDSHMVITSSAQFNIPLFMMRTLMGNDILNLSVTMDASNLDGRRTLLLYKSILEGAEKIIEGMS